MKRKITSLLAALKNVVLFGTKYETNFPALSAGGKQFAIIKDYVNQENTFGTDQSAGGNEMHAGALSAAVARHYLHDDMIALNRAAHSLALLGIEGIEGKFKMPHHNGAQAYINAGRAFVQDAAQYSAQLTELGFDAEFITHLQDDIAAYEKTIGNKSTGQAKQVGATRGLASTAHDATIALHILDTIVRYTFRNDPAKLGEWISASHVERHAPVPKEAPATPATTTTPA